MGDGGLGRRSLGFGALALLAGCSATPPQALYTLAAVPGAAVPGATVPGASNPVRAGGIELRRVGLAGYLDRDSIVRSAAGYRLDVVADARWAEPLGRMLDRVLSENLGQRLPNTPVLTESGPIGGAPALILEVNIQRLDADADGAVVLLAQVALRRDGSKAAPQTRNERLSARPDGPGTAALVACMSRLLGELADRIAPMAASAGR